MVASSVVFVQLKNTVFHVEVGVTIAIEDTLSTQSYRLLPHIIPLQTPDVQDSFFNHDTDDMYI